MLALEGTNLIKLLEAMEGEGGLIGPLPSTFDTIHTIDLTFGTNNELSLNYQLIETTWYLIGFHRNHNHINDVTSGRHLEFFKFLDFLSFST